MNGWIDRYLSDSARFCEWELEEIVTNNEVYAFPLREYCHAPPLNHTTTQPLHSHHSTTAQYSYTQPRHHSATLPHHHPAPLPLNHTTTQSHHHSATPPRGHHSYEATSIMGTPPSCSHHLEQPCELGVSVRDVSPLALSKGCNAVT